ncbi:fungal-specific transcription factor domain-containing protein [Xylogone sp. PMI_703]|nr:fungal-specific transcription factor domain-containing protein [Xylogone sp. PMI_703]
MSISTSISAEELGQIDPTSMHSPSSSHSQSQSPPPSDSQASATQPKKRTASASGLENGEAKPVKRRAAKACAACRARKVRCDVMQRYHVSPDGEVTCSNCTMDGIRCIIEESKRKRLAGPPTGPATTQTLAGIDAWKNGVVKPTDVVNPDSRRWSTSSPNTAAGDFANSGHVPHSIYQSVTKQINSGEILQRQVFQGVQAATQVKDNGLSLLGVASVHGDRTRTRLTSPDSTDPRIIKHKLPPFLKPLPQRMSLVDIDYLFAKGSLSLPETEIRNALLRSYIEYVHPYMPLLELHEFLHIINEGTGESGKISLLLFQAVMFAGTAFVDMEYLKQAGFTNRKAARKAFFQKARVLYDFDYEVDRVSLVQSLLLMTYWYETPDDQKDTWHWMGVAISLAHTIGLHRNPEKSNMDLRNQKLWKRIWWSCFMRDRLVALGMRRPTRVKDEDYDVPMLTEDDFEIRVLSEDITIIPLNCTLIRDVDAQRELAQMCIAKAKLCLCVSHVLSAQYSVLVKHQGMQGQEGSARSSVMLFPKKLDQTDEVRRCDIELNEWINELPLACHYSNEPPTGPSSGPMQVQKALLHMVYFTTLSALHRPQVLPSASSAQIDKNRELQDLSRKKVREASREITRISQDLHSRGLERYLPTTGVTVLLPAIIIHLLDIKSCNDEARQAAMEGFCQCMLVLEKLRDNYASADFATQFLEAAIRKADIDMVIGNSREKARLEAMQNMLTLQRAKELRERQRAAACRTPPLAHDEPVLSLAPATMDMQMSLSSNSGFKDIPNTISARTPPESDLSLGDASSVVQSSIGQSPADVSLSTTFNTIPNENTLAFDSMMDTSNLDLNMNDFLNFDTAGNDLWNVPLEEGAHGESGGFMGDMNWVDQAPGWSRLNSPRPEDGGDSEKNNSIFGIQLLEGIA